MFYCETVTRGAKPPSEVPRPRNGPFRAVGTGLLAGAVTATAFSATPNLIQITALIIVVVLTAALNWPSKEESNFPMPEWAVIAAQICGGIVVGALLWLVCEWLWQRIPVAALVVALAVTTGLVWVVRRVREVEDLQTTVIAVLVGLFVTMSPAALLLVDL